MIKIFVGYDPIEAKNYAVLTNSITRLSSQPVAITPLNLTNLPMYKEVHLDGSTQFSYSRFLTPFLTEYQGWAIYMDSDMLVLNDIDALWKLKDNRYAVQCVKHNYSTKQSIKFCNNINNNYDKKNWGSLMLFNCSHPALKSLTPRMIEASSGAYLHQFQWLDNSLIGDLPIEWNWLADEYGENYSASLIHYTLGSPNFKKYKNTFMSDLWFKELNNIHET